METSRFDPLIDGTTDEPVHDDEFVVETVSVSLVLCRRQRLHRALEDVVYHTIHIYVNGGESAMAKHSRRKYLGAVGAAVAVGLAGCAGDTGEVEQGNENLAAPDVDAPADTWDRIDTGEVAVQVDNVGSANGQIETYGHGPSRARVRERTRGEFDRPVGLAFAGKFDLNGWVMKRIPLEMMEDDIKQTFESKLTGRGIEQVKEIEPPVDSLSVKGVDDLRLFGYSGVFSTGSFSMDVEVGEGETRTFEFPNQNLGIQSLVALWKKNGDLYVSGGAWPSESYDQTTTWVSVTGSEPGEGADAKVRVHLSMMRSKIKSDVVAFAESTR